MKPEHTVYRCYGDPEETELLYVGRTSRGETRFQEHARSKDWWGDVDHCTVQPTNALGHAARVERTTIRKDHPQHNVTYNR